MEKNTFGGFFNEGLDGKRIRSQQIVIRDFMLAQGVNTWLTLQEINNKTGYPTASISAQLRHLKKAQFGGYTLNKRRRSLNEVGSWEYQLLTPAAITQLDLF